MQQTPSRDDEQYIYIRDTSTQQKIHDGIFINNSTLISNKNRLIVDYMGFCRI